MIAILAGAGLFFAAPHDEGGDNKKEKGKLASVASRRLNKLVRRGVFHLRASLTSSKPKATGDAAVSSDSWSTSEEEQSELDEIIQRGDDPEAVARLLEGSSAITYNYAMKMAVYAMIEKGRNRCLAWLFPRLVFLGDCAHTAALTIFLQAAIGVGNIEAADFLLRHGSPVILGMDNLWHRATEDDVPGIGVVQWDLSEFKRLVSKHAEKAAVLAPTYYDLQYVDSAADAQLLIDLALHCDAEAAKLGNAPTFDASAMLGKGLFGAARKIADAEMAELAKCLCQLGAEVNWTEFNYYFHFCGREAYPLSREILQAYEAAQKDGLAVKVTEEDADSAV
jgi:hypothetical protein